MTAIAATDDMDYATIDIDKVLHMTDAAVLVRIDEAERWLPFSVLGEDSRELLESAWWDGVRALEVSVWFAEKEGLV